MKSKIFFLTAIYFLTFEYLNAQNFKDALRLTDFGLKSNARALGMGNAYTSLSDDFSAASFNPAGFGLVKRLEFSGGLNYNDYGNDVLFMGNKTDYSNSVTELSNVNFVFPFPTFRGSLVFAIGYNRDKSFNNVVEFDGFNSGSTSMIADEVDYANSYYFEDLRDGYHFLRDLRLTYPVYSGTGDYIGEETYLRGNLNQSGSILNEGSIGIWSFAGAMEVAPNSFVGISMNVHSGAFKRDKEYYEDDTRNFYPSGIWTDTTDPRSNNFQSFILKDYLEWDISGFDLKLGYIYQMQNLARFGLSIKFPTTYTIKEKYSVYRESSFGTGSVFSVSDDYDEIEYDISTPFVFSGGASVSMFGAVLSADASFIDYKQMKFGSGLDKTLTSLNNKDIKYLFRSVLNLNFGAEYTIPVVGLRLRSGYMLYPSPYKGDPKEFNRKFMTFGIGFLTQETLAIDVAFARGWWKDYGDNYGVGVSRTYQDITVNNLLFGVSYRF